MSSKDLAFKQKMRGPGREEWGRLLLLAPALLLLGLFGVSVVQLIASSFFDEGRLSLAL